MSFLLLDAKVLLAPILQQLLNCKHIVPLFVYPEITNAMMTIIRQFDILVELKAQVMDEHHLIFHHPLRWQLDAILEEND